MDRLKNCRRDPPFLGLNITDVRWHHDFTNPRGKKSIKEQQLKVKIHNERKFIDHTILR